MRFEVLLTKISTCEGFNPKLLKFQVDFKFIYFSKKSVNLSIRDSRLKHLLNALQDFGS